MMSINETDKAYAAGFIDGEGYLGIMRHENRKFKDRPYYRAIVKVAQTRQTPLLWLQERWGGWINKRNQKKTLFTMNYADAWYWTIGSKELIGKFIADIRPYLQLKNKQADVIMQRLELQWKYGKEAMEQYNKKYVAKSEKIEGANIYDEAVYNKIKQLWVEIKELNKKGPRGSVNE